MRRWAFLLLGCSVAAAVPGFAGPDSVAHAGQGMFLVFLVMSVVALTMALAQKRAAGR